MFDSFIIRFEVLKLAVFIYYLHLNTIKLFVDDRGKMLTFKTLPYAYQKVTRC